MYIFSTYPCKSINFTGCDFWWYNGINEPLCLFKYNKVNVSFYNSLDSTKSKLPNEYRQFLSTVTGRQSFLKFINIFLLGFLFTVDWCISLFPVIFLFSVLFSQFLLAKRFITNCSYYFNTVLFKITHFNVRHILDVI